MPESLASLTEDWAVRIIMDPASDMTPVIALLKNHWKYDLYARRPGPALLKDGVLEPTDLDLACFMSALVDRRAVINLPRYKSRRPTTTRSTETVISKENRHGNVLGLSANKEVFSFSVRIWDANVVTHGPNQPDGVGAFRNFMMVDLGGAWWSGWDRIEFFPSAKENSFLENKNLWTGNTVYFKNFVHPNRWQSFYGKWYFVTKLAIARLTAEAAFCRAAAKRMKESGVVGPKGEEAAPPDRGDVEVGESMKTEVVAFEAEVDMPFDDWEFPPIKDSPEAMFNAYDRARLLSYTEIPLLRFPVRATELAFYNKFKSMGTEPMAAWFKDTDWERNYKEKPTARTLWNRLAIVQPFPFVKSMALRYRIYKKTEQVAAPPDTEDGRQSA